ncbi:MAG: hypothetical protein EA356_12805 [Geminicoccaceae bacterium]|nr:MAG: hypothetical protein EA356_12805 [Geminicoccaceae bacterium]
MAATRVRCLHVRRAPAGPAMTARALVEDALRTEGDPPGPARRGGLLVIRRLDVGVVRGSGDRQAVALRVRQALMDLADTAVLPSDARAETAPSVRFETTLEPYRWFAKAIAEARPSPDAWFFRALFDTGGKAGERGPAWACQRLVAHAGRTPFRAAATAESLAVLLETPARRERFLPLLAPLVFPLRRAFELPPADAARGGPSAGRPDGPVRAPSLAAFGLDHPTSQPLVAAARQMANANPALAEALIAAAVVRRRGAPATPPRVRRLTEALRPSTGERPPPLAAEGASRRSSASSKGARPKPPPPPRTLLGPRALPSAPDAEPAASATPPTRLRRRVGVETDDAQSAQPRLQGVMPTPATAVEVPHAAPGPALIQDPRGLPSAFAGAVLAAALLDRAARPLLVDDAAIEADLGRLVLSAMLRRVGALPSDPALDAFAPELPALDLAAPVAFALPVALWPAGRLAERPIANWPGWRARTCRRGWPVVAAWPEWRPPAGRLERCDVDLAPAIDLDTERLALAAAWAARRLARQLLARPVRTLLRRPGHVLADRTHVTITFAAHWAELDVRRAALDVDLGWCPWLWRVVRIVYDYGGDGER